MKRVVFVIAVAVASAAVCGTSTAAPIAPVPAAITDNTDNVIQAYYYHRHYYPHRWHGHYYGHRHYWHGHYRYWR